MAEPQGIAKWWQDLGKTGQDIGYQLGKPGAGQAGLLNFGQSVQNFLSSKSPAATGAGAGDIRAQEALRRLALQYPAASQAAGAKGFAPSTSGVRTPTPPQGTRGYVAPTVTPASVAANIKKPSLTGGTGGAAAPAAPKAFGAMDLYSDPASIYDPAMDQLEQQKTAANERYAKNQAGIKNLFGALSDLSAKDALRIQDQFKTTIASQQANLAARTATANAASAAGVAQAQETGAERGMGPEMATNPLETATAEGIGRSNEYQTTWEALQNANANQAVIDATSRQTGYGQQQVGALQQLQQNLEDKLLQIGGNETAVQQDIAKARYAAQQQVRDTLYNESQQKAQAAASASAGGGTTTAKAKSYPKSIFGLQQEVTDLARNEGAFTSIQDAVNKATALVTGRLKADPLNVNKKVTPSKADVIRALGSVDVGEGQTLGAQYVPYAIEYVNKYSGLK